MARIPSTTGVDQPSVHHFIRVFGHRPTVEEIARHERAQARRPRVVANRARRRVADLIVRLGPPRPL